ncbi:hypothetical protein EK21DRAFT_68022 [Setomelanomma holmii]|uniref:Uncharacterized protein n=1 Tax=Setomelanomma holmii TaxID=210430 RepID=A0A9P4H7Z3_9PLEO|nr:hypothetical protein EK21DRAFT_68022 [Setomelanomma holmii]
MLAPRASTAFVCLRCELQLARRRMPAHASRSSHANFSASARRHDGAEEWETTLQAPTSRLRIRREREPLDRIRRRKGKAIRETSARLGGLKQMGEDAEILVLRELEDQKSKEPETEPEPESEPVEQVEVPDILASIQQENRALTAEEVYARLESLQPKNRGDLNGPHYVTQTTFVKIIRDLMHGFNQRQLSQFYSTAKNLQETELHKEVLASLREEKGTTRPTTRTNWQPGITPSSRRLPGADVSTRSKRAPVSKQLLVDRIMRDVWKLVPLEEVEAAGELEISLKPWQLALLNAGENETSLNKISSARKVRIEVHKEHNVIRITADKNTAEYAADDVDKALDSTEVRKLQLKSWIPSLKQEKVPNNQKLATLFTQEDFDMITSLTRASIQRMDNANTLVLRGLDQRAVAEAERLLLRLLPLKDATLYTVDPRMLDTIRSSCRQVAVAYDQQLLDYKHRNAELGRWSSSLPRLAAPKAAHEQDTQDTPMPARSIADRRSLTRILKSLRDAVEQDLATSAEGAENREMGYWSPAPEYKLSADFGHALFPLQEPAARKAPKNERPKSPPALLSHGLPGLATLMPEPCIRAITRTQTPSLLYDFIPAPEQLDLGPGQDFPRLRIQMRTSPTGGDAVLHKLSLGFHEHVHDVLIPDQAADIQFCRYGRLRFRKTHRDKNVHEWVKAVCENIASGERLTAPSLTIDIPKWTIPGFPADAKGLMPVTYLFSGIQFRQTVSGSFMDTQVSYNTTQSGKTGARGGALSMYYVGVGQSPQTLLQDEESLASFVKKCFSMVDHITEAAAQTQPTFKMLRPRTEQSGRKVKRSLQQAMAPAQDFSEASVSPVVGD